MDIYSIYKITNLINSKSYIGKTSKPVEERFKEHLTSSRKNSKCIFHSALRKYGVDNFSVEVIFQSTSNFISEKDFTNIYEPLLIEEHHTYFKNYGYNMTRGGDGFDSETAKENAKRLVESGKHCLLKRKDGSSIGKTQAIKSVEEGTHPFQTKKDGSNIQKERIKNGNFHFQKRQDGTSISSDSVLTGTHNLLDTIHCVNVNGKFKVVHKTEYNNQIGFFEEWEWVSSLSEEGLRRRGIKHPRSKIYRVYNTATNEQYMVDGKIKLFCKNNNIKYLKMLYDQSYPWKHEEVK